MGRIIENAVVVPFVIGNDTKCSCFMTSKGGESRRSVSATRRIMFNRTLNGRLMGRGSICSVRMWLTHDYLRRDLGLARYLLRLAGIASSAR